VRGDPELEAAAQRGGEADALVGAGQRSRERRDGWVDAGARIVGAAAAVFLPVPPAAAAALQQLPRRRRVLREPPIGAARDGAREAGAAARQRGGGGGGEAEVARRGGQGCVGPAEPVDVFERLVSGVDVTCWV
jgi:hypothetical protein